MSAVNGVVLPKLTALLVSDPSVVILSNVIPVRLAPDPKYSVAPTSPPTLSVLAGLVLYIPTLDDPVSTLIAVVVPAIGFTFISKFCLMSKSKTFIYGPLYLSLFR